jgi:dGTPase
VTIREDIEAREDEYLSPYAARSAESRGRERPEEPDPIRTCYMRDRDRIIHCKSFRRLKHKTQVFLAPVDDHYRTRLTHTLEVSQVSRTIARALRLNEDLTEAVALGHDLGHTPFGHMGEEVFHDLVDPPFQHNRQSLRMVEVLEYDRKGLNLTLEVRDGILNHTGEGDPFTLEGKIVRIADRIAYVNHDLDDALRAGIISEDGLPPSTMSMLGRHHSQRINTLVTDMIESSMDSGDIRQSPEVAAAMNELRTFLFDQVYIGSVAKQEEGKAQNMLRALVDYYMANPEKMPPEFLYDSDPLAVRVIDYVAGMTDTYAKSKYEEYFVPRAWRGDGVKE